MAPRPKAKRPRPASAADGGSPQKLRKTGPGAGGRKPAGGKKPASPPPPQKQKAASAAPDSGHPVRVRKKNAALVQDAVKLWEALRPKDISAEERSKLVTEIMGKVQGKLLELANHHTASRIIQFLTKYGNKEQRHVIMDEVKANMVELAKSKYGHHLVLKLIKVAAKEDMPGILRLFKGHAAELLRHPYGSDVMAELYDVSSGAQRNALCAEFYGREYVLFDGVTQQSAKLGSLSSLLEGVSAAKKRAVLVHFEKALSPIMEKAILHPAMVHRLVKDFLRCAPGLSVEDAVDTLCSTGGSVLKMVHTHDGAAAACMLLAYGTARDRKRLVKAFKGFVKDAAINEWGHAVLANALSVVDDTSLLTKVIVAELKAMIEEAVEDQFAGRVLLQLLSPDNPRYLPPAVLEMMHPPQRTVVGGTGAMVTDVEGGDEDELVDQMQAMQQEEEEGQGAGDTAPAKSRKRRRQEARAKKKKQEGDGNEEDEEEGSKRPELKPGEVRVLGVSKKDPVARRRELLGTTSGGSSLASVLTRAVATQAGTLLRAPHACDLVVEVARGGEGGLLRELDPEGVAAVQEALLEEAESGPGDEAAPQGPGPAAGPSQEHVFTHYYSSRALRRLLLASTEEGPGGEGARQFASSLWQRAVSGRCKQWASGHGGKVLAALATCGDQAVCKAASKELTPLVAPKSVEAWAEGFVGHVQGGGQAKQGGKAGQHHKQQQPPAASSKPSQHTEGEQAAPAQQGQAGSKPTGKGGKQPQPLQQQQQQPPKSSAGKQAGKQKAKKAS